MGEARVPRGRAVVRAIVFVSAGPDCRNKNDRKKSAKWLSDSKAVEVLGTVKADDWQACASYLLTVAHVNRLNPRGGDHAFRVALVRSSLRARHGIRVRQRFQSWPEWGFDHRRFSPVLPRHAGGDRQQGERHVGLVG